MKVRGDQNPEDVWNDLKEMIHESFGNRQREDLGWYTASLEAIEPVIEKKWASPYENEIKPTRTESLLCWNLMNS